MGRRGRKVGLLLSSSVAALLVETARVDDRYDARERNLMIDGQRKRFLQALDEA